MISIPFSSANFLASGEASVRPPSFETTTGAGFAGAATGAAVDFSATGAGVGVAAGVSTFSSTTGAPAKNAEISSPGAPIIAKIAFTGAALAFSTPICNKVPS